MGLTMNSGIYCIENLVNGKMYIGKAFNLKNRKNWHFSALKNDYHFNQHLQRSFNKYGVNNFAFYIIEYCQKEKLSKKEKQYIRIFDTYNNGYNMTLGGEGMLGWEHSEETKEKISKAQSGESSFWFGKHLSKETREKISKNMPDMSGENHPMWGKHLSEETKKRISKSLSGENAYWYGKHHSEESKEKMSGENNHSSKLTENQIFEILNLYYNKELTQVDIAKEYDVSNKTIHLICNGKRWSSCYNEFAELHPRYSSFLDEKSYNSKLIKKQVFEILNLYYNKRETQADIAKIYGVHKATISCICLGKTWKLCYEKFMETQ